MLYREGKKSNSDERLICYWEQNIPHAHQYCPSEHCSLIHVLCKTRSLSRAGRYIYWHQTQIEVSCRYIYHLREIMCIYVHFGGYVQYLLIGRRTGLLLQSACFMCHQWSVPAIHKLPSFPYFKEKCWGRSKTCRIFILFILESSSAFRLLQLWRLKWQILDECFGYTLTDSVIWVLCGEVQNFLSPACSPYTS